ncbi:MAG: cadherin repeat domain-containing protein, partial [Gammaproteobacteria bacterium]|nr:cadherin repeat domain-containing protein [Gammaproteobacteria bacterium]
EDGPTVTFDLLSLFTDVDDATGSLVFSIVSNDNPTLVLGSIDAVTGQLILNAGADLSGVANLVIRATDAAGGFDQTSVTVTVDPVDDAVINILPAGQSVEEGQFLLFSSALGTNISVTDIDSTNITITLSVAGGLLTLGSTAGLSFSDGDGVADQSMTFTGTVSAINAALDGLLFQPGTSFAGIVPLQIDSWSPDLPLADRAPVSSETLNILVLEALAPVESELPDAPAPPVIATPVEPEPEDEKTKTESQQGKKPTAETAAESEFTEPDIFADFTVPAVELPAQVEPALVDSGFEGTRERITAVARMLLELGVDGKLPAFIISDAVMDALDSMRDELGGLDDADSQQHEFLVTLATGLTLTLSAGFVSWIMRAGALLTSLLSTTPLWQRFDPLPVLASHDEDNDEEEDADAVRSLFGANQ